MKEKALLERLLGGAPQELEALLGIETERPAALYPRDSRYHRYEPTPYAALGALFSQAWPREGDELVDFGCGCGRVSLVAHALTGVAAVGVEMDRQLLLIAQKNRAALLRRQPEAGRRLEFVHCLAQDYPVEPAQTIFYFFNPFSPQVFNQVVQNILCSVWEAPRRVEIWLYYPSVEAVCLLEYQTPFKLEREIRLPGLYDKDPRECFYLYRLDPAQG